MTDVSDARLLEQFARNRSEEVFAALVQRYIALVHSVALRHTANPQHAEDITQAVFIILARKAGALGRKTVLPGWLYHTARLTAANLQRAEARRVRREQEAFMQSQLEESPTDNLWRELSPQLDEAMAGLGAGERDALVLRYFQNKSMAEVGGLLGLAENTAQKRVSRALEKLRQFFFKRGVSSTTAAIAGVISAHSVQAAPAALAKSVTAVALAKGAAASTSTLTLIKGALKLMAWTKMKTAAVAGAAILLATGTTMLTVKTVHAIRAASPPDIQGAWEGAAEILGTSGVLQGEKARSRVVFQFFKTNGVYAATGEFIDTAPEPFQTTKFVYDYPSIQFAVGQGLYQGKVNAAATEIAATLRRGNLSAPVLLKRTAEPAPAPEPLVKNEYAPRIGSDLQGTWKTTFGSGPRAVRVTIKIAEPAPGTFRAELDNLTTSWLGQPLTVTYNPPKVELRVASGAGMFRGVVRNGETELAGNWLQDGHQIPIVFNRADR